MIAKCSNHRTTKENNMNRLTVSLLAAGLMFGVQSTRADSEKEMKDRSFNKSANEIIGKKVTNAQDQDLGKVQDIIVNVDAGTAPYAIIATGGVLGANRAKVAVPLSSLRCSADGKEFVMSATKEQLQSASRTATGAWAPVAGSDWARRVDAFYGQPAPRDRFARDSFREDDSRTYARDPQPKGAELLMTPQDAALCEKICDNVETVHVRVQNGVTHLYGQVENEEARKNLEAKVRAVPGVNAVESHLKVKNP
jgi:sporulation protein YlmC with PRC-barrel domain